MKHQKHEDEDDIWFPDWLRYVWIVLAILALIVIMTKGTGPFIKGVPGY